MRVLLLLELSCCTYSGVERGESKDAQEDRSQAGHRDVEWVASEDYRAQGADSFECRPCVLHAWNQGQLVALHIISLVKDI